MTKPVAQFKTLPHAASAMLGTLIEPVDYPDFETAIGLVFVQGAGLRIGMMSGGEIRQMSPARARRLAGELEDTPGLAPLLRTLREKADELDLLTSAPEGSA